MKASDVLNEISMRFIEIILQGGKKPEKIIVSKEVYNLFMDIKTMPRSVEYINGVFYIAGIPVEEGILDDPKGDIWFRIL